MTLTAERTAPWLVLCPGAVVEVRGFDRAALAGLAPGTEVAVVVDGPFARRRLRRLAAEAGVTIDRELIVLPSTTHPVVVVDDVESAVQHLWRSVAAVPPGVCRTAPVASAALRLAGRAPWSWTGGLAPGRVLVGVRA